MFSPGVVHRVPSRHKRALFRSLGSSPTPIPHPTHLDDLGDADGIDGLDLGPPLKGSASGGSDPGNSGE